MGGSWRLTAKPALVKSAIFASGMTSTATRMAAIREMAIAVTTRRHVIRMMDAKPIIATKLARARRFLPFNAKSARRNSFSLQAQVSMATCRLMTNRRGRKRCPFPWIILCCQGPLPLPCAKIFSLAMCCIGCRRTMAWSGGCWIPTANSWNHSGWNDMRCQAGLPVSACDKLHNVRAIVSDSPYRGGFGYACAASGVAGCLR